MLGLDHAALNMNTTLRALWVASLLAGFWTDLDGACVRAIQQRRTRAGDRTMQFVSRAGNPVTVLGALLLVAVTRQPAGVATARVALVSLAATNLVVEGLKAAVGRRRPDGKGSRWNSSFPSSHAANACALALVFAERWPRGAPAFWGAAALVAFSRVYLDRHYPSDVLVGALIGWGLTALALGSSRARRARTRNRQGSV
jgi:undecaprenyl-diphosphatase